MGRGEAAEAKQVRLWQSLWKIWEDDEDVDACIREDLYFESISAGRPCLEWC